MRFRASRKVLALALGGAVAGMVALLCGANAKAERLDPSLPIRVVVGPPPGPSPMARVDGHRSGRTRQLPDRPRQLWERRIRGGMALTPVVDSDGSIVIAASAAELVQLDARGKEQWRHNVGMSVPTAGPVILNDGTRVVATALGDVVGFDRAGSLRFRTSVAAFGTDPRVAPLARDNGTLVIAVGTHLVVLGSDGTVHDSVDVGDPLVGTLAESGPGIVATTNNGRVIRWSPPAAVTTVGRLKGSSRTGVVVADAHRLLAVVDVARLVEMNLQSGAITVRLDAAGLQGPPAVDAAGAAYVTTATGTIARVTAAGPVQYIVLGTQPVEATDAGSPAPASQQGTAPVVVDDHGRIAFAREDGRVGVVVSGTPVFASQAGCSTPFGVVPAGAQRFLVACRDGVLRMYGP